ncbi:MAG: asparaginase [Planctomycetes bacterium]|nr:asparaginase [Planctomycetota bacterium]
MTRVLILYTGGTAGMGKEPGQGYRPIPGFLEKMMRRIPLFQEPEVPAWEIHQYDPLLDSSDMRPRHWSRIARDIQAAYEDYDGFLVVHGTDTMAYTASALSFMLRGLRKPVLLTGSQIPLSETRNDALDNLLTALLLIGRFHDRLAEVCVFFDNTLYRGNRTTKIHTEGFDAFASPDFPPLGEVGIDFELNQGLLRPRPDAARELKVCEIGETTVGAFRVFPGLRVSFLEALLAPPVQGLVLECFGAGNAPTDPELMAALRAARDRGVVVVAVPQPLYGAANLELYANGRALLEAGVVSGRDMTVEAALAKLFYLYARGFGPQQVRSQVQLDLRGELTEP